MTVVMAQNGFFSKNTVTFDYMTVDINALNIDLRRRYSGQLYNVDF